MPTMRRYTVPTDSSFVRDADWDMSSLSCSSWIYLGICYGATGPETTNGLCFGYCTAHSRA